MYQHPNTSLAQQHAYPRQLLHNFKGLVTKHIHSLHRNDKTEIRGQYPKGGMDKVEAVQAIYHKVEVQRRFNNELIVRDKKGDRIEYETRAEDKILNDETGGEAQKKGKKKQLPEVERLMFPDPYIRYKIIPAYAYKKALDVTAEDNFKQGIERGTMIIWDYHGGPNQLFYLEKANNDTDNGFYIISSATGFVLDVPNGSTQDGQVLHVAPRRGSNSQIWKLEPWGQDLFRISSFCGKVLDVKSSWLTDGSEVIQYHWKAEGENQLWKIWPS